MAKADILRDPKFAKRLEIACENQPLAPVGHGRQAWLRRRLADDFGLVVTNETTRKWFGGVAKPRPKAMAAVAKVLSVDVNWLTFGEEPEVTLRDRKKSSALANGAVNLVAGHIQLAGGNIYFPDEKQDDYNDVYAVVRGKHHAVNVVLGTVMSMFKVSVPTRAFDNTVIIAVPTRNPLVYEFFRLPPDVMKNRGQIRNDHGEFKVDREKEILSIGGLPLSQIRSFDNLDGVQPSDIAA